jgi:molybdenum cofactor cytidylyltransferase
MKASPVIVVVAAGRGSRFRVPGTVHRLLAPFAASTVLDSTLRHVLASRLPLVVVTTAPLVSHAAKLVAARDIVVVPDGLGAVAGSPGMGRSIAAGVSARGDAPGWVVMPADLPLVQPQTLRSVADALRDHPLVYAQHRGHRAHPVGFSAELFSELVALSGDEGARRILARYPSQAVDVDDEGVLMDVDADEDPPIRVRPAGLRDDPMP